MIRCGLRRAALLCAWFSDLKLQCLFATFLSTSLDDFEALGANFSDLGGSWGAFGGGRGGVWGVLGPPLGGPGPSWSDLGPSWTDMGGHPAAT